MADPGRDHCRGAAAAPVVEKLWRWTPEAEAGLAGALHRDRDAIAAGVDSGSLELWRIDGGRSWMVTRIECGDLVVCCYQGERVAAMSEILFAACRRLGLTGIRFFTARHGLARMLAEFGFRAELTMYRCEVPTRVRQ